MKAHSTRQIQIPGNIGMHTKLGGHLLEWRTCKPSRIRTVPHCPHLCFTSRMKRGQHGNTPVLYGGWRCQAASSTAQSGDSQPEKGNQADDLVKAMSAVRAALENAEANLQDVESLPSSRMPREAPLALKLARVAATSAAAVAAVVTSHLFDWPFRIIAGFLAGAALGLYGFRKGSLSRSGGIAAALVGGVTLSSSARAALVLLALYFTSSKLTTYCEDRKLDDESFKKGGQRDWKQVFCNGFVPMVLALAAARVSGGIDLPPLSPGAGLEAYTPLTAAFLGYFCCCCGDTWASELGQLSQDQPRLITSLRPVRKGTNGGVTRLGLLASAAGGLCMGLVFYVAGIMSPAVASNPGLRRAALHQFVVILFGLAAGLAGSLVDSVLGATVQFTGYNRVTGKITSKINEDVTRISGIPILDNNAVNFVSASFLAAVSAALSMLAQSRGWLCI